MNRKGDFLPETFVRGIHENLRTPPSGAIAAAKIGLNQGKLAIPVWENIAATLICQRTSRGRYLEMEWPGTLPAAYPSSTIPAISSRAWCSIEAA